jgi:hypothetical protein
MEKSREDYAKFCEMVLARAKDNHDAILLLFGEKEGKQQLKALDKKPRGRAKGSTRPEHDQLMLWLYDMMASTPGQDIRSLPRKLAQLISSKNPGMTVGALEKRVRRLLKQREEERRARRVGNPLNPDYWPDK